MGQVLTSIGPTAGPSGLPPSNSASTSKKCSFQSSVFVTTTDDVHTLPCTYQKHPQKHRNAIDRGCPDRKPSPLPPSLLDVGLLWYATD